MKLLARLSLCAVVAISLAYFSVLLLTKLGGPQWAESLDLAKSMGLIRMEMERADHLQARGDPVFRCTAEKGRIVRALIAHQLAAPEALRQFRKLDEAVAEANPNTPRLRDKDATERNVLIWVRGELVTRRTDPKQIVAELDWQKAQFDTSRE